MSGNMYGLPPGTQWLQQMRQPPQADLTPHLVSSQVPEKGSWQFGINPNEDGTYDLHQSGPNSDSWRLAPNNRGLSLSDALYRLQVYRDYYRGSTGYKRGS